LKVSFLRSSVLPTIDDDGTKVLKTIIGVVRISSIINADSTESWCWSRIRKPVQFQVMVLVYMLVLEKDLEWNLVLE